MTTAKVLRATPTRTAMEPTPDELAGFAAGATAFATELLAALAATSPAEPNLWCAPLSVATALLAAETGARGRTEAELAARLHPGLDARAARAAAGALARRLAQPGPLPRGATGDPLTVRSATACWLARHLVVEPAFLDALAADLDAGVGLADFAAPGARGEINAWVADRTAGRIPELLDRSALGPDARLLVVNAVHLLASWEHPFSPSDPIEFATAGRGAVMVEGITRHALFAYAAAPGWQAVEVPCLGRAALLVVLPAPGRDPVDAVRGGRLDEIVAGLASRPVTLTMPRLALRSRFDLRVALEHLGLREPFADTADFSGITTTEPLQVSGVVHAATLTLDEAGIEASAASAVGMRMTGAPAAPPLTVTVDRPYAVLLRDTATGAVLFAGRVLDPSGG